MPIKYQKLSRIELFLIVPLTFMGMVNVLQNGSTHEDWADRVHALEEEIHNEQVTTYNTSACYQLNLDSVQVLLRVQKRLNIKGYYATQISIKKFLFSFRVRTGFPFTERINEIAGWIQSAGLYNLWLQEHDKRIERGLLRDNRDRQVETEMEKFPLPMFIVYGWSASAIIFFVETLSKNNELTRLAKGYTDKLRKKRTACHTKETKIPMVLNKGRNRAHIEEINEIVIKSDVVIFGPKYGPLLREYKQMRIKTQATRIAQQRLNILTE